ncbi:ketopantoate reductase family protein [Marisediminicola senii]|uniref:ketopantoate reductase family protein n=1 Tax=Marisediminicola senii TaxID=2711233 RepID=UPI0013EB85D2|nr:ketopantoate reductase family protein [Marisediminicola senii]
MRILVIGAGAVGGYFGARLAQAGRDVTFLVRPARAALLAETGLVVRSAHGDVTLPVGTVTADRLDTPFDLVVMAVKAYGLEAAMDDAAPAIGPNTVVLPLLNGMRHLDVLAERFGRQRIVGGLCVVAAQVDADGGIHQLMGAASVTYGEFGGADTGRIRAIDAQFTGDGGEPLTGFGAALSPRIEQDMWEKWVFLATLGAIGTLLRGSVGAVAAVPGGTDVARELFDECASVAAAHGFAPRADFVERSMGTLTAAGSPFTSSMYRDLLDGKPVEAEQVIGDLFERGRGFGLELPLLRLTRMSLRIYENGIAGD